MANEVFSAAEFQSLPLEFIIVAPLSGAVKAQAVIATNIKTFIDSFKNDVVQFSASAQTAAGTQTVDVKVPLLAAVPVPHLRIDSLTVSFRYEISQVVAEKKALDTGLELEAGTTGLLANWVKATLKGSVTSRSSTESTTNRAGHLEITLHASEGPMPEGLARILSLLAHAVPAPPSTPAGP